MTIIYFVRHAAPNYRAHSDAVLSGPYKRAVDTVRGFADAKGLEITLVDGFRERKVQKRNIDALNQVLYIYNDKNIGIGSHGTALSTIINDFDSSFEKI